MRFGFVVYGPIETTSGGYLYDRMLVENLRRRGDSVDIVSLPHRHQILNITDNLRSSLRAGVSGLSIDLLLQDELSHPSLFWLNRRLAKTRDYPIVSIVHHLRTSEPGRAFAGPLHRTSERLYLSGVDGFICNSRATLHSIESITGIRKPTVIAAPGRDHLRAEIGFGEIRERAAQLPDLRMVYVGNVVPRKGLHHLLEALERVEDARFRLTVAGSTSYDPEYGRKMERRIRRGFWNGEVVLGGQVPQTELVRLLRESHVLAVPSSYEGFGIAYLEGMGFGLAVVGSAAGGAAEMITDGREGFLVAGGDIDTLAERIRALARDRKMLAEMGVRARERYLAHPTWERTSEKVRSFLRSTVLKRRV